MGHQRVSFRWMASPRSSPGISLDALGAKQGFPAISESVKLGEMSFLSPNKPALLIVDDDEDQRGLFRMAAERSGVFCKVAVAEDGLFALEQVFLLIDNLPASVRIIVLADLKMPRMGGTELARRLKPTCDALPVFFVGMSSCGYGPDVAAALAAGCSAFLEKPGNFMELKEMVASLPDLCVRKAPKSVEPAAWDLSEEASGASEFI